MSKSMMSMVILFALGGACGGAEQGEKTTMPAEKQQGLLEADKYADEMCACKTQACLLEIEPRARAYRTGLEAARSDEELARIRREVAPAAERGEKCAAETRARKADVVTYYRGMVDEICACKDMACVEGAQKKMAAMAQSGEFLPKDADEAARMAQEIAPQTERMQKCLEEIAKRGAP